MIDAYRFKDYLQLGILKFLADYFVFDVFMHLISICIYIWWLDLQNPKERRHWYYVFANLDKDRELAKAHSEIKGLRLTERAKDKALAEVTVIKVLITSIADCQWVSG